MTGVAPHTEGAVPRHVLTAAPGLDPNGSTSNPQIVPAQPGQIVELPFTLAAATVALRGDDLYLQAGDRLVVIQGYGAALQAGMAPTVVDPRGDTLALGSPHVTSGSEVVLTDSPEAPPQPAQYQTAGTAPPPLSGGGLFVIFDPVSGSLLRALRAAGTESEGNADADASAAAPTAPEFDALLRARTFNAASKLLPAFSATDDAGGSTRGHGAGDVIAGWGSAPDVTTGGKVTEVRGTGATVPGTDVGVDVAGQFGSLHIASDGSAAYQRSAGSVSDLVALPNGATDAFSTSASSSPVPVASPVTIVYGITRTESVAVSLRPSP